MKKFTSLVLATVLAFTVASCGTESKVEEQGGELTAGEVTEGAKTVMDRMGNEITIPEEVNSIVSLSPSNTETLIDLGLGDKIVAVDTFSFAQSELPDDVVTFDMVTPDIEGILALNPDLIVTSGISLSTSDDPFAVASAAGTTVTYITSANTLEEIKENVLLLGAVTKTDDRANEIVTDFDVQLAKITEFAANYQGEKRTVYFEINPAPSLYSFGTDVFLNEIIELLNTENVFAEQKGWIPVTEEEIFARNPQIIFTNTYLEDPVSEIVSRAGWENIDAVANGNVFYINQQYSSQDNEYVINAINEMAEALYPEFSAE